MTRLFCLLGFHRFQAGYTAFGMRTRCERCHAEFRMIRAGMTDDARFVRVVAPRG